MTPVVYYLDRTPFKNYNVFVSDSSNLFDKSSFKESLKKDWGNEHGYDIDLQNRFQQSKTITLSCFIPAQNIKDCFVKYNTFLNEIDKKGSRRISVEANDLRLEYQVFRTDALATDIVFDEVNSVGTFKLKLVENFPIKRVLKTTSKITSINLTSKKVLVINWGDGIEEYTSPLKVSYSHTYNSTEIYYPMILGDLDSITLFNSNAQILWSKL